jgi:hypothetical protein
MAHDVCRGRVLHIKQTLTNKLDPLPPSSTQKADMEHRLSLEQERCAAEAQARGLAETRAAAAEHCATAAEAALAEERCAVFVLFVFRCLLHACKQLITPSILQHTHTQKHSLQTRSGAAAESTLAAQLAEAKAQTERAVQRAERAAASKRRYKEQVVRLARELAALHRTRHASGGGSGAIAAAAAAAEAEERRRALVDLETHLKELKVCVAAAAAAGGSNDAGSSPKQQRQEQQQRDQMPRAPPPSLLLSGGGKAAVVASSSEADALN